MLVGLAACGGSGKDEPAKSCDEMQAEFDTAFFAGDKATMDSLWVAMVDANCNPD